MVFRQSLRISSLQKVNQRWHYIVSFRNHILFFVFSIFISKIFGNQTLRTCGWTKSSLWKKSKNRSPSKFGMLLNSGLGVFLPDAQNEWLACLHSYIICEYEHRWKIQSSRNFFESKTVYWMLFLMDLGSANISQISDTWNNNR